jgi:hypothetical protein
MNRKIIMILVTVGTFPVCAVCLILSILLFQQINYNTTILGLINGNQTISETEQVNPIIPDLSAIYVFGWPYLDESGTHSEGVEINLTFYDSQKLPIIFSGIPIVVQIEMTGCTLFNPGRGQLPVCKEIYKGEVQIDRSGRQEDLGRTTIRIPFSEINTNPEICMSSAKIHVIVKTIEQGIFESDEMVILGC